MVELLLTSIPAPSTLLGFFGSVRDGAGHRVLGRTGQFVKRLNSPPGQCC